jgi:hypothetical protein
MAKVISDIIMTPVRVLYSPVGTSLPADTVAAAGNWPAGWVELGYTSDALKLGYKFETKDFFVQQSLAAVRRQKNKEELGLETQLAELDGSQLALTWGATNTPTAAGAGQPGKEEIVIGDEATIPELQWGFEGAYVDEDGMTFPVRVFIWKATAVSGGELEFSNQKETGVPLKLAAVADMTKPRGQRLMKLQKILEPATS